MIKAPVLKPIDFKNNKTNIILDNIILPPPIIQKYSY